MLPGEIIFVKAKEEGTGTGFTLAVRAADVSTETPVGLLTDAELLNALSGSVDQTSVFHVVPIFWGIE